MPPWSYDGNIKRNARGPSGRIRRRLSRNSRRFRKMFVPSSSSRIGRIFDLGLHVRRRRTPKRPKRTMMAKIINQVFALEGVLRLSFAFGKHPGAGGAPTATSIFSMPRNILLGFCCATTNKIGPVKVRCELFIYRLICLRRGDPVESPVNGTANQLRLIEIRSFLQNAL